MKMEKGGGLTVEGNTGTSSRPPFSGHFLALETHHFKPFSSSGDPYFYFLKTFAFPSQIFANVG